MTKLTDLDNEKYTDLDSLLNSPDFQTQLDSLILPASDNTADNLEDSGRFPEGMASETEESWDEPTEEDIETYLGYYDYRM